MIKNNETLIDEDDEDNDDKDKRTSSFSDD